MSDMNRRKYLKALGATAVAGGTLAGCATPRSGDCAVYDKTVDDLLRETDPAEVDVSQHEEEEIQAWRHLEAYREYLDGALAEGSERKEQNCPVDTGGSTFVGEQHGMGDGIKTMATELENNDYDVLALEFFSSDDPIVEAFNEGSVYEGVYDRFDGEEIGAEEMAEHYLHPQVRTMSGDTLPIRWPREKEELTRMFEACKEQDATLVGVEPEMYHPLYPKETWGDETRKIEDPDFFSNRFETMVDNVEAEAQDGDVLALSGYAHVQNEMHAPMALLIGALPGIREYLAPEDNIDNPWSYMPLVSRRAQLPFYATDEETYTYSGRMPAADTMLSTSAGEQLGNFNAVSVYMDRDTAASEAVRETDLDISELLQEDLPENQPLKTETYFDFMLDLRPSADFDDPAVVEANKTDDREETLERFAPRNSLLQRTMDGDIELT